MSRLEYMTGAGGEDVKPRWANEEKTGINMTVFFPHLKEWVPFTALPSDPGWEHGEELFARAIAGEFGPIAEYVERTIVPTIITRRQCAKELFERKMITGPEMVAMVRAGIPPAIVSASISTIQPIEDQYRAEVDFASDTYERMNPLLLALMTGIGASSDDIDDFFISASKR